MSSAQPNRRIPVTCSCGATFTVDAKFAGRMGTCPKCRQALLVPAPGTGCPKCGSLVPPDELFCPGCGEMLPPVEPEAPAAPRLRSSPDTPTEVGPAPAPRRRPDNRPTEIERAPAVAAKPPPAAIQAPASPAAAPAPPEEPAAAPVPARRTPVLRNKLAELDAPRRPLALRLVVFLVFAGGGSVGAFYLGRSTFQPLIARHAAAEAAARQGEWPPAVLEKLRDRVTELSETVDPLYPNAPLTPEQIALHKTLDGEFVRLKKESQEAEKRREEAHTRTQNWQVAWYGYIALLGILLGALGWRISG
ncbi:MAG: zinc ribbon domain-containing protein [Planctomycetes bacterium]|nr:zinc ribbon domain-containing protein [Planctomycetota bacterium]